MGLDEELVVTISRVGLTLASGVYIKKLTSEQQVETSPMPSNGINFDETRRNGHLKRNLRYQFRLMANRR